MHVAAADAAVVAAGVGSAAVVITTRGAMLHKSLRVSPVYSSLTTLQIPLSTDNRSTNRINHEGLLLHTSQFSVYCLH